MPNHALVGGKRTEAGVLVGKISKAFIYGEAYENYEGSYAVTPRAEEQYLPTKNKLMIDDIKVKAIPYVESNNNAGGTTVTIG